VTRELIHERLECLVLFAQQAAEGANHVLLEGSHDRGHGPVSHAITVAPHCGARHHVNAWFSGER
jgi:hypothetical protein